MDAQAAIEAAESALISAQREFEDSKDEELYAAEKNIEAARRALKKAQENKAKSQTEAEIESVTYKAELSEKEKLRDTLKRNHRQWWSCYGSGFRYGFENFGKGFKNGSRC